MAKRKKPSTPITPRGIAALRAQRNRIALQEEVCASIQLARAATKIALDSIAKLAAITDERRAAVWDANEQLVRAISELGEPSESPRVTGGHLRLVVDNTR